MRKYIAVICLATISGCMAIATNIATMTLPKSDYLWWGNSSSSYAEYVNKMRLVPREINIDNFGMHYINVSDEFLNQMAVSASSEAFLRNAFKVSSGVLEPIYRIDRKGVFQYDENVTQMAYDFLVSSNFRMQPFSETQKIVQKVDKYISGINSIFAMGNFQRDAIFFDAVLKDIGGNPSFYVHDGSLVNYVRSRLSPPSIQDAGIYVRNINFSNKFYFLEMPSISQAKADNFSVLMNGAHCGTTNIPQFTAVLDQIGTQAKASVSLNDAITARAKIFDKSMEFCTEAFRKIKLSRKMDSDKL